MIRNIPTHYGLNCTINTTEDCNLRCKYCYETCKRPVSIDFDKCRKFIDLCLQEGNFCQIRETSSIVDSVYKGRVFDFIGGDSLMDPELLDRILTYINTKWSLLEHKPPYGWRASISSNGTLFDRKDVRDFCEKWKDNLHVGVSIDGCPEIHDKYRVFPDGSGSMAKIMEWWPWFQKTFPIGGLSTKATCSKASIPYLYESLKFMHEEMGIHYVNQNFIMEDMHLEQSDLDELDKQLEKCCGYVLEHCDDLYWAIFDRNNLSRNDPRFDAMRADNDEAFKTAGTCGSGCMPALGIDGKIYPCFRWLPHTQNGNIGVMCVGDTETGFSSAYNFRTVADGAIRSNCTKEQKCRDCEFEHCCHYCIGGCYAEYGDFIRTTHICEVTKLTCKWATIYWDEWEKNHTYKGDDQLCIWSTAGDPTVVRSYDTESFAETATSIDTRDYRLKEFIDQENVPQMIASGVFNTQAALNPSLLEMSLFKKGDFKKSVKEAIMLLAINYFLNKELHDDISL